MKRFRQLCIGLLLACGGLIAAAVPGGAEETQERIEKLEREVDRLQFALESGMPEEGGEARRRVSIHGYGELHYNNPKTGSRIPKGSDPARMDFHRMVWGLSYHFNDRVSLHTEVDFEHAAQEMELEFAYLDFLIGPAFNIRAGSMLMPVGPLNEFHEPPLFYSVERPYVQAYIIPTTWMEGGVGAFGLLPVGLKYRVYGVSGLNAEGFSADQGLRGGRGKVASAPSEELAAVGRLEYFGVAGLDLGGSIYWGGANATKNDSLGDPNVTMLEGDARYRKAGLDLRGVIAWVRLQDADLVSTVKGQTVGKEMLGWYVEGAYDLLRLVAPDTHQAVMAFVRYEAFDTHHKTPAGFSSDDTVDRNIITAGLAYYPLPDIVIKADLERWEDATDDKAIRFNLGLGYQF